MNQRSFRVAIIAIALGTLAVAIAAHAKPAATVRPAPSVCLNDEAFAKLLGKASAQTGNVDGVGDLTLVLQAGDKWFVVDVRASSQQACIIAAGPGKWIPLKHAPDGEAM